jgi:hypothetical protein
VEELLQGTEGVYSAPACGVWIAFFSFLVLMSSKLTENG